MSAPSYFGSVSSPADNGTGIDNSTQTVTPPASMLAGDLVVFVGACQVAAPTITVSATGGQSWDAGSTVTGTDEGLKIFWCEFNGTWSVNPALNFSAEPGSQPVMAVMHVFRPVLDGIWAVNTTVVGGTMTSASPQPITGITPTLKDNVTVACWAQTNTATWSALSGTGWVAMSTSQWRTTSGTGQSLSFAHQLQGSPVATNDVSLTPSTATTGAKFIMAWNIAPKRICMID